MFALAFQGTYNPQKALGALCGNFGVLAVASASLPEPIARALRDAIAPLVEGDGGTLYLVAYDAGIRLHLSGACSGCPGARMTATDVIEPALRAVGARGPIEISSGWLIPDGAERISAQEAPTSERVSVLRRSR